MSTTTEITVGDTGLTRSGTLAGGGLTTLAECTVTYSLLRADGAGRDLVTNVAANITDAANLKVSVSLSSAVAKPGLWKERWTVTLPVSGLVVHFPGPLDAQVYLRINP